MNADETTRLAFLLAKFCSAAELIGSRGRARFYGRDPYALPSNTDYDYAVFTDNKAHFDMFYEVLYELVEQFGFVALCCTGGITVSNHGVDLIVYPTKKRNEIHQAWKLMEDGLTKEEAWRTVNTNQ